MLNQETADEQVLAETVLPSIIYHDEVGDALQKYSVAQNYPVGRVKLYDIMDGYAGFGTDYYVIAKKMPPIPGGWSVVIKKFEPQAKRFLIVVSAKDNPDKPSITLKYILQMMDEYRRDGLIIQETDEYEDIYGSRARYYDVKGYPVLIDSFEEFIENMR